MMWLVDMIMGKKRSRTCLVGVLLIGLILGALFFYVGSARPVMTAFSDEMTASQQTYSELETEKEELEGELPRKFDESKLKDTLQIGTVGFAAPEQFEKQQSDRRTDLFSLGAFCDD